MVRSTVIFVSVCKLGGVSWNDFFVFDFLEEIGLDELEGNVGD